LELKSAYFEEMVIGIGAFEKIERDLEEIDLLIERSNYLKAARKLNEVLAAAGESTILREYGQTEVVKKRLEDRRASLLKTLSTHIFDFVFQKREGVVAARMAMVKEFKGVDDFDETIEI